MPKPAIIAYVPALHAGYRRLFDKYPKSSVYVLGPDIIATFDHLRKDLRALKPEDAAAAIKGWGREASVVSVTDIEELKGRDLIMPDEDVSHELTEAYFDSSKVTFEPIFLRWDRRKLEAKKDPLNPDRTISTEELDQELMKRAAQVSRKSTDIYRRIGGLVVKDGVVILEATNLPEPLPHTSFIDGDVRMNANRSVNIDLNSFMHAEARLIAEAANRGISLRDTLMYVTDFPCPTCAKLVAKSGVNRLYYANGYAVLDGEEVLKAHNVELIHVAGIDTDDPNPEVWVPYPEKKS